MFWRIRLPASLPQTFVGLKGAATNATVGANLSQLMDAPVRGGSGPSIYLRDIGIIENGTDIITAYAHVNGKRTVYIPVTKRADASTLAVIDRVKKAMPSANTGRSSSP